MMMAGGGGGGEGGGCLNLQQSLLFTTFHLPQRPHPTVSLKLAATQAGSQGLHAGTRSLIRISQLSTEGRNRTVMRRVLLGMAIPHQ